MFVAHKLILINIFSTLQVIIYIINILLFILPAKDNLFLSPYIDCATLTAHAFV